MPKGGRSFHSLVYMSFMNMCNTLVLNGRYEEAYAYLVAYATYLDIKTPEHVEKIEVEYYKLLRQVMLRLKHIVQTLGIQTESDVPQEVLE